MNFQEILEELLEATNASRTTLRLDWPERDLHVDTVAAEATRPGVRSLKEDSSLDQRALATVRFLEEERRVLVQDDCLAADPAPPQALIDIYGVKAQMLGPLVHDGLLIGWISVHYTPDVREWSESDVESLRGALERMQQEITTL